MGIYFDLDTSGGRPPTIRALRDDGMEGGLILYQGGRDNPDAVEFLADFMVEWADEINAEDALPGDFQPTAHASLWGDEHARRVFLKAADAAAQRLGLQLGGVEEPTAPPPTKGGPALSFDLGSDRELQVLAWAVLHTVPNSGMHQRAWLALRLALDDAAAPRPTDEAVVQTIERRIKSLRHALELKPADQGTTPSRR